MRIGVEQWNENQAPVLRTYEDFVSAGQALVETIDRHRWELGDLADKIAKSYGEDTLGKFAGDIGVGKKTLYAYRQAARFYDNSTRQNFADTNITYSHMRLAMRLNNPELALEWLQTASENGWTVDKLAHELQALLGVETERIWLVQSGAVRYATIDPDSGLLHIEMELPEGVTIPGRGRVKVSAWVEEEESNE